MKVVDGRRASPRKPEGVEAVVVDHSHAEADASASRRVEPPGPDPDVRTVTNPEI